MSFWVKRILDWIEFTVLDGFAIKSYSQEGEDMILRRLFEKRKGGFYVDVGAHHPKRFSNTFYFYKKRWRGINIDAMPGSMRLFDKIRPRDINVEAAISSESKEMCFYVFNEPALNTLDESLAKSRTNDEYYVTKIERCRTRTLADVLDEKKPAGERITFMSVDAEGFDLDVLRSNDWGRYRPEYLLVECYGKNIQEIQENILYQFLCEQQYEMFAKSVLTVIFRDERVVSD